jgi:uncharacterized repeat protein (TIGR03803 family)
MIELRIVLESRRKLALTLRRTLLLGALFVMSTLGANAGVTLTTLHSFEWFTNGATPASLVRGNDSNYYGTTVGGGTYDYGTIFKITTNGALTTMYSFTGSNDGGNPYGGLILGADGNFYGAAYTGGASKHYGTIFKFTTNGALSSLYSFTGGLDGGNPFGGLIQTPDGVLYGTGSGGGASGWGNVFKVTTNGALTNLYAFTGGNDGSVPYAPLVRGTDGNLYGTTRYGGTNSDGTVFKITTNGALTSLLSFNLTNGANPQAGLVQSTDGNFYGTTFNGGTVNDGTIFRISSTGAFSNLYSFTGVGDGGNPFAKLVIGSDGTFYGTGVSGGASNQGSVFGYRLTGVTTNIYSFTGGTDGGSPSAPLLLGTDGLFYGTTTTHGSSNVNSAGTVFKLASNGIISSLYVFTCANEGEVPYAGVVQGTDGLLYGTVSGGGSNSYGAVFKISTNGILTSLYSFLGSDGANPQAPVVQGTDGNFYGTTYSGGTNGQGTVFKIATNGILTSLYSFSGPDGSSPVAGLVQAGTNFYGATYYGGDGSQGVIFRISSTGVFSNLYSFSGGNDGAYPAAALVRGTDGILYGTAYEGGSNGLGTVFKITTNGAFTSLYSFSGPDGSLPQSGLVQALDGNFYGVTSSGGSNVSGNIFKISPTGTFTSLYVFTGGADGASPYANLIQAADGNLYGTTFFGGAFGNGGVFRVNLAGAFTNIYSFVGNIGGSDGANPQGGVIQGLDGSFYGTTLNGGQGGDAGVGDGTVFRLTVVGPAAPVFQAVTLSGKTVNLTWATTPGSKYQLQYETNPTSGAWVNLGGLITAAGTTISTNDSATNGQRYYRAYLKP